jgi:hypothetical protein
VQGSRYGAETGFAAQITTPQFLPDGQITQNLSSPIAKNIPLVASGKSVV